MPVPTTPDLPYPYLCVAVIPQLHPTAASFAGPIQAPSNYTKPESIQKYIKEREVTRNEELALMPVTGRVQQLSAVDPNGQVFLASFGANLPECMAALGYHLKRGGYLFGLNLRNMLAVLSTDVLQAGVADRIDLPLIHREFWDHPKVIDPVQFIVPGHEARRTITIQSLLQYYNIPNRASSAMDLAQTINELVKASGLHKLGS